MATQQDAANTTFFRQLGMLYAIAGAPSLRDVAKLAGCSHDTVRRALKGPKLPTSETVQRVVKALRNIAQTERELPNLPEEYRWPAIHRLWVDAYHSARQPTEVADVRPGDRTTAESLNHLAAALPPDLHDNITEIIRAGLRALDRDRGSTGEVSADPPDCESPGPMTTP